MVIYALNLEPVSRLSGFFLGRGERFGELCMYLYSTYCTALPPSPLMYKADKPNQSMSVNILKNPATNRVIVSNSYCEAHTYCTCTCTVHVFVQYIHT